MEILHRLGDWHHFKLIEVNTIRASINAIRYEPDIVVASEAMQDGGYKDLLSSLQSKQSVAPVIIVSTNPTEACKVEIFEAGAVDCINVSTGSAELLARICRTLRRSSAFRALPAKLHLDAVEVDAEKREVFVDGRKIAVTDREYDLLEILIFNGDRVVSKDFICSRIWTVDTDPQIVRYYVKRLRDKLGYASGRRRIIKNVPGIGYRYWPAGDP